MAAIKETLKATPFCKKRRKRDETEGEKRQVRGKEREREERKNRREDIGIKERRE